MKAVQTGQLQPMANDGQTNLHRVALYIALLLAMATGTAAQAEAYIPKPFPKPPRPLYIPVPIPKPDELFVYLHCMVVDAFPGERAIDYWAREGRDYWIALEPCGWSLPQSECLPAAKVVNDFRPLINGRSWKLFFAAYSERAPRASI